MVHFEQIDERKGFYKLLASIAIPIVMQHLINIGLNMIDTVMIGRLGESPLAAVGIANRLFFVFAVSCFGFYSGASVFVAQYWGIKDIKSIQKLLGIQVSVGLILSTFFFILFTLIPQQVMNLFIDDPLVIEMGVNYISIIRFSFLVTAISFAISFNSRSIHRIKVPTMINVIAIAINTFLNFVLIYGMFGMPALGVTGAAYATLIARIFEFFILLIYIYQSKDHPLAAKFKDLFSWNKALIKKVLVTSLPVFFNEIIWVVGTSVYFVAYGMIGPEAVAVVQVTFTISDFFQSLIFGMGGACAVMLGNELGKNNLELAYTYAIRFIKLTFFTALIMGALLYLARYPIIQFYDFKPETNQMLNYSLIVSAIYLMPKMQAYIIIIGILRSGGDTKFCMYLDFFFVWFVGVPIAFFTVLVLKWPIYFVLAAVFLEEVIKGTIVFKRVLSRVWLNNLTH